MAADANYPAQFQVRHDGKAYVPSGATITVESGGTLTASSGATVVTTGATVTHKLADNDTIAGPLFVHPINVPDGTTGNVDVVITQKIRVLYAIVVKVAADGGASDTLTITDGTTAITNAIDLNITDKTVKVVGTIDDAVHEIAAGGTLRATRTKASAANVACKVYVIGMLVA